MFLVFVVTLMCLLVVTFFHGLDKSVFPRSILKLSWGLLITQGCLWLFLLRPLTSRLAYVLLGLHAPIATAAACLVTIAALGIGAQIGVWVLRAARFPVASTHGLRPLLLRVPLGFGLAYCLAWFLSHPTSVQALTTTTICLAGMVHAKSLWATSRPLLARCLVHSGSLGLLYSLALVAARPAWRSPAEAWTLLSYLLATAGALMLAAPQPPTIVWQKVEPRPATSSSWPTRLVTWLERHERGIALLRKPSSSPELVATQAMKGWLVVSIQARDTWSKDDRLAASTILRAICEQVQNSLQAAPNITSIKLTWALRGAALISFSWGLYTWLGWQVPSQSLPPPLGLHKGTAALTFLWATCLLSYPALATFGAPQPLRVLHKLRTQAYSAIALLESRTTREQVAGISWKGLTFGSKTTVTQATPDRDSISARTIDLLDKLQSYSGCRIVVTITVRDSQYDLLTSLDELLSTLRKARCQFVVTIDVVGTSNWLPPTMKHAEIVADA